MSVFGKKNELQVSDQLSTAIVNNAEGMFDNDDWVLKMIPKPIQDFLLNILKKALKRENAECMVLYIDERQKSNKKIEEQVRVITLKKDPGKKITDLEKHLADQVKELNHLRHRNKHLEGINVKYLNLLQNGVQSHT